MQSSKLDPAGMNLKGRARSCTHSNQGRNCWLLYTIGIDIAMPLLCIRGGWKKAQNSLCGSG